VGGGVSGGGEGLCWWRVGGVVLELGFEEAYHGNAGAIVQLEIGDWGVDVGHCCVWLMVVVARFVMCPDVCGRLRM
jgi:hypothetical protein